jgi:ABC-type phosphate/phosphonate transport system permease subunit
VAAKYEVNTGYVPLFAKRFNSLVNVLPAVPVAIIYTLPFSLRLTYKLLAFFLAYFSPLAAFSAGVKLAQAAFGRYLFLPLDGLPSEVFHFCLVHFFKDC